MGDVMGAVRAGGRNLKILGILAIVLGCLAIIAPGIAGLSVAMVVGWLVVAGGILRMFWAFRASSLGKGILGFAIGVLTLLCGLALVANPLLASGVLTLVLAAYFVVDGIFELAAASRVGSGGGWLVFGGIVSILLGVMIWAQFPLSGAWAIGVLLGIKLLFVGMIMVSSGSELRAVARG